MEQTAVRKSNIELLRILGMLMIVAHHFVVNTGIIDAFEIGNTSANYIYLTLLRMWGPTGLNITVLISGYFMCRSNLTLKRYCKILFEFLLYHFGIYLILLIAGYETAGPRRLFELFFEVFRNANGSGNFTSSFLVFYLFIPFINPFIQKLGKNDFTGLLLLLLFVFTGFSTFFDNKVIYGEVSWFFTVYLIGAYLRMHPPKWSLSLKASARFFLASVILAYAGVIFMLIVGSILHNGSPIYFLFDCNKLGSVLLTVSLFATFKNMNIGYSKIINLVAKTTFGVLLIHASSGAMRTFMWRDLLHVDAMSSIPTVLLIVKSILICAGIFTVCSLIDMIRIFTVEKYVFDHFDPVEKCAMTVWTSVKNTARRLSDEAAGIAER